MTKKELEEIQGAVKRIEAGETSFTFKVGGNYFDVSKYANRIEIVSFGGTLEGLRGQFAMTLLELGNTNLKRVWAKPGVLKIFIEP